MLSRRAWLAGGAASLAFVTTGRAQKVAIDKPLKVTVGFAPGGSADIVARLVTNQMRDFAPSIIVENKPGAGGRIGLQTVKNDPKDGTSLVLTPASMMVLYPHVYKELTYRPLDDFETVTSVCAAPFAFAVGPAVPAEVKTLKDFLDWSKANPKSASYGTSGAGSMPHFAGVSLVRSSGTELTHVPYRGGAPAMQDLVGGTLPAVMLVLANVLPQAQAGQVRVLAVTSPQRSPLLPNVPTMREAGFPEAEAVEWFGVFAPKGTPVSFLAAANAAIKNALGVSEVRTRLEQLAFLIEASDTPDTFRQRVARDIEKWAPIVKASGYTAND